MSKLIQMRRRIKAIETIKKVTDAMRLLSMSTHSRLKRKQTSLALYQISLEQMLNDAVQNTPGWVHPILQPAPGSSKTLVIIIGSQKGLCGNFNNTLVQHYIHHTPVSIYQGLSKNTSIVTVGKKVSDVLQKISTYEPIQTYEVFTTQTFLQIAHSIADHILTRAIPYERVIVWSNKPVSFFIQKPTATTLVPYHRFFAPSDTSNQKKEYLWEYTAHEMVDALARQDLKSRISSLLFESLLSEYAARFISMDSSTRNAQNMLDEMQLQYNKDRQTSITRELAELAGSF